MARRSLRAALLLASLIGLSGITLHAMNFVRFRGNVFRKQSELLIARSRYIREQARPEYEREALASLRPNSNNGTVYRLDDRIHEAVVTDEALVQDASLGSGFVFAFEFNEAGQPSLRPAEGLSIARVQGGLLHVEHDQADHLTNSTEIAISKDDIGEIVIRARADLGSQMRLAWSSDSNPDRLWSNRMDVDIIPDGRFHRYVINAKNVLKRGLNTGDSMRTFIVKPSNVDRAVIDIDYIRFVSKRAKYSLHPRGTDHETFGGEMRPVLYMLPSQTLTYDVAIPETSPTLEFGIGSLMPDNPIAFEVMVAHDGARVTIFHERLTDVSQWLDTRLDLSRWAGRSVRLSLRVAEGQNNVAFWSNPILHSAPNRRFNVIILLEDALRADHLSTYDYGLPTSPSRDSLVASSGIVFAHAVSQATKTRPSVPALMTSLLPTATGVWNFSDMLNDRYLTLAEIMRSQGFVTASFIQNGNAGPYAGLHQGFSYLFDSEAMGGETEEMFGARLKDWLEQHSRRNFFLYLHIRDPHSVYDPPVPYDLWYREALDRGPGVQFSGYLDPPWEKSPTLGGRRLLYDGEIRHNDAQLGMFFKQLRALRLEQNTLLILLSDHGEHLGEHGLWEHHPPGLIQVLHVPLIVVYPTRFKQRKTIAQTVQLIDVMPTVLELADVDTKDLLMFGTSLVDLIEARRVTFWDDRICVSEEPIAMPKDEPYVCGSLFFRDLHLITSASFRPKGLPGSLRTKVFNFMNDLDETRPIRWLMPDLYFKHAYARLVRELQSNNIAAWKRFAGGDIGTYKMDPDVLERLRALGYVR